ncbi:YybH family protein [Tundrisphaera sp. TA3]|uniref:YybH family protein n=1 Tax=Tundrisphaera sp. TA3 TaxID=3435775 RepID=UPI003EBB0DDF
MNTALRSCLMATFLLALAPVARGDDAASIAAIRKVLDSQVEAWNRGDLDGFLDGYWHDPGVVFQSGGDRNDGFEAMKARYVRRYKADGKAMGRVAFTGVEVLPLAADSAFVRGSWKLDLPDGGKPGGLFTLVFRRFPDGWKIVHDHTSMAPDPKPQ